MTDRLATALRAFQRAEETLRRRRFELHEAIAAEVAGGRSKSAVARDVGYTREYVLQICKAAD